jgi:plastocyanin
MTDTDRRNARWLDGRARVVAVAAALSAVVCIPGARAGDTQIVQKDKAFSEHSLRIHVGDTVTFVNADTVTHNVYSLTKGCEFELQTQLPGNSTAVPFSRACTAQVQCAIHPKMKLTVDVVP